VDANFILGLIFMTGTGGSIYGIDDPHTESEALAAQSNPAIYDKVYEWYTSGPRQRLQPGGSIIVVMTRWSKRDLTGQIINSAAKNNSTDIWDVIEFPAILPSGKSLWPEYWSLEALDAVKAEIPNAKWRPYKPRGKYVRDAVYSRYFIITLSGCIFLHWYAHASKLIYKRST